MRIAPLAFLITLLTFSTVKAWVSELEIQPAEPDVGDSVTVIARGGMFDRCWSVTDTIWTWLSDDTLSVDIYTYDCALRACAGCIDAAVDYERSFTFRAESTGRYFVRATDYRDSLRDPGENGIDLDFVVEEVSAVTAVSWGEIKQAHR